MPLISSVWDSYRKLPDSFFARCVHCGREYSYKTTITNLKKHLRAKHSNVYSNLNEKCKVENEESPQFVFVTSEESRTVLEPSYTTTVKTTPSSTLPPKSKQRKQQQDIPIVNTRKLDDINKKEIDTKLLEMITQEYLPFSIVEEQGFQDFVKLLNPNYELPNRKKISKTMIPDQYRKCKNQIKELVDRAKAVCLTTDCWTSIEKESFLAVTAHFLLEYELKSITLHCEFISGSHTVDALALSLQSIVQEWGLSDKVSLVVSNNSFNIKKAIEKNQWPHFDCFVHKINVMIEKAFDVIDFIIQKVRKIVAYFKRNTTATESLLNYQCDYENKSKPLRLIRSNPTKWNTVYLMLERFSKLQSALQTVISKLRDDIPILSSDMWSTIKQIVMILQPFEEATRIMSSTRYLTASLVIIIVDGLKNVVQLIRQKPLFDAANTFLDKLEESLNEYFSENEIKNNMLLGVSTLLDPRFKIHAFLDHPSESSLNKIEQSNKRANLIKQHLLNLIKNKIRERQQPTFSPIVILMDAQHSWEEAETITIQQEPEPETISIWGKIDKNIAAITPSHDDISSKAINELDMFLKEEVINRSSCPLAWWKQHAMVYPNLAEIFHDHGHIVLSSVPCARLYSKSERMLTDKKLRLSRKHTGELVFLNNNESYCKQMS